MRVSALPSAVVGAGLLLGLAHSASTANGARITGGVTSYAVAQGDTWRTISARAGVDAAALAAENGLPANAPLRRGQVLRIDNRHIVPDAARRGLTVNVPQRMLFYEWEGGVAGIPVAVGQATWRTPTQAFTVVRKETDPTWDVPASIREEARRAGRHLPLSMPPGPSNPLGKYWLGLSIPSVGIHGTDAPSSIYRVTTHGCIRVGPDDIAWLFPRVAVGTPGEIIYEPILLARTPDDVFLEVHADVYRRLARPPLDVVRTLAAQAGLTDDIDWSIVDEVVAARHGVARSVRRARPVS